VAFGLVLMIDENVPNRPVIVTTSLFLVVSTTVILGSTVATVSKCLFRNQQKPILDHEHKVEDVEASHHEEFLHPNLEE